MRYTCRREANCPSPDQRHARARVEEVRGVVVSSTLDGRTRVAAVSVMPTAPVFIVTTTTCATPPRASPLAWRRGGWMMVAVAEGRRRG
jgi:hypothetical protein